MIRHTVAFRLRHPAGSTEERAFLEASLPLASIPGVQQFEQLRQISPKSEYTFGFSMEFADDDAYQAYNVHPLHVAYVSDIWIPEVEAFQEIDYTSL